MPTRNDMTGGTLYFSTSDGKAYQAFEGVKKVSLTCVESDDDIPFDFRFPQTAEFTATVKLPKETMALLLGFKNYNCYSRYIRRRKRRAEQERRRRLKRGY